MVGGYWLFCGLTRCLLECLDVCLWFAYWCWCWVVCVFVLNCLFGGIYFCLLFDGLLFWFIWLFWICFVVLLCFLEVWFLC